MQKRLLCLLFCLLFCLFPFPCFSFIVRADVEVKKEMEKMIPCDEHSEYRLTNPRDEPICDDLELKQLKSRGPIDKLDRDHKVPGCYCKKGFAWKNHQARECVPYDECAQDFDFEQRLSRADLGLEEFETYPNSAQKDAKDHEHLKYFLIVLFVLLIASFAFRFGIFYLDGEDSIEEWSDNFNSIEEAQCQKNFIESQRA